MKKKIANDSKQNRIGRIEPKLKKLNGLIESNYNNEQNTKVKVKGIQTQQRH